jgi:hypothetical protein
VLGLGIFGRRIAVGDDAGPGLNEDPIVGEKGGAQGDADVRLAAG